MKITTVNPRYQFSHTRAGNYDRLEQFRGEYVLNHEAGAGDYGCVLQNDGIGRELSKFGTREFTNIKTVWIDH